MGGGDLNLKKSWAPNIMANQRRVWEAEKAALEDRKRIQEVMKEREEERAIEELRRLQMEASGNSNLIDPKVAWMYQDQKGGLEQEAAEGYLLGRRRVDQIILKQDTQKEDAKKTEDPLAGALSARDISAKAALDPLLAIERQRTANIQDLMSDPIARRRMMKDMERRKRREERNEKHKHRRSDERDESRDRRHRSKRRRHNDESEDEERYERRRERRYEEDERESRRHQRPRRRGDSRSRSPRRRYSRSRSPPSMRANHRDGNNDTKHRSERRYDHEADRGSGRRADEAMPSPPDSEKSNKTDSDRAAKLAAMSANADDLEGARNRRLAEMEARDAAAKAREDNRRDKRGDKFVDDLREQAGSKGLGERLQRASGGLARLEGGGF